MIEQISINVFLKFNTYTLSIVIFKQVDETVKPKNKLACTFKDK